MKPTTEKVRWQGTIKTVQSRARVWRYKTDNRTHYLLGFNLWVEGQIDGSLGSFIVAISGTQQRKLQFRIGDGASGTAWAVENPKREVAGYYRAGALKVRSRANANPACTDPPFANVPPDVDVYEKRGARMLDANHAVARRDLLEW
jgi:hypothetical protein